MAVRLGWYTTRRRKDRNKQWEARWADESGTVRARFFLTDTQAKTHARNMAMGVLDTSLGLAVCKKSLQEARDSFLARSLDPKTTALYERRIDDFLDALPAIAEALKRPTFQYTGQISDDVIHAFDKILIERGANPGGRQHILKIVRTFCKFCIRKTWLRKNPFLGFKMSQSDFEGRLVTPEEFERLCSTGWQGRNQFNAVFATGTNQYAEVDIWLARAFKLGRETMLRISQVWELTPKHFKAPDQLWVRGIKDQDGVWITLRPAAISVVESMLEGRQENQRFFDYWSTVESMRSSVHDKATRVGLKGVRFHDACKVSRVSELDALGMGLGELSELSNTSKKTLAAHYIKADRKRAFNKYQSMNLDHYRTTGGPEIGFNAGKTAQKEPMATTLANSQNGSTSPQNPSL